MLKFDPKAVPSIYPITIDPNRHYTYGRGYFLSIDAETGLITFHAWSSLSDFADPDRKEDRLHHTNQNNRLVPYKLSQKHYEILQKIDQKILDAFEEHDESGTTADLKLAFYMRWVLDHFALRLATENDRRDAKRWGPRRWPGWETRSMKQLARAVSKKWSYGSTATHTEGPIKPVKTTFQLDAFHNLMEGSRNAPAEAPKTIRRTRHLFEAASSSTSVPIPSNTNAFQLMMGSAARGRVPPQLLKTKSNNGTRKPVPPRNPSPIIISSDPPSQGEDGMSSDHIVEEWSASDKESMSDAESVFHPMKPTSLRELLSLISVG